ncbi:MULTISPECIES: ABC transporter permease [Actinosynnema]|uniref:ABC transporter permease n=1 Tax=Actinosynnema TaxID=40566 RepID=UPI0020A3214D|nr:ABC transporter permease [Actinosynnema pretiosum]MCP2092954.1 lipooligosaccharide transport system permease protein [Actinosynnema pretiosum]
MTTREARSALSLRIVPPGLYAGRSLVLLERSYLVYRRAWVPLLTGLVEPLLFLFSLGFGIGRLVADVEGVPYAQYVAPALLATAAMNGAVYDAVFGVFVKFKYAKTYDAVLATPAGPMDIALGEVTWSLLRGGLYSAGFTVVILALDLAGSAWALLMLPASLLVAAAFAAVGMAVTTFLRGWQDFDLVQLVIMPMFLFSATFYPVSVYPEAVRGLVQVMPLYQATTLMRDLNSGNVHWGLLWPVLYFLVLGAIGVVVAARRLGRLLLR